MIFKGDIKDLSAMTIPMKNNRTSSVFNISCWKLLIVAYTIYRDKFYIMYHLHIFFILSGYVPPVDVSPALVSRWQEHLFTSYIRLDTWSVRHSFYKSVTTRVRKRNNTSGIQRNYLRQNTCWTIINDSPAPFSVISLPTPFSFHVSGDHMSYLIGIRIWW